MTRRNIGLKTLTDEEIIQEFVKRFECDGAVLVYLESNSEYGFGKWQNELGKVWVKNIFNEFKKK
ncbi:MAG: hypothetical protein ACO1G9_10525 [Bacteroidota bacterium]